MEVFTCPCFKNSNNTFISCKCIASFRINGIDINTVSF